MPTARSGCIHGVLVLAVRAIIQRSSRLGPERRAVHALGCRLDKVGLGDQPNPPSALHVFHDHQARGARFILYAAAAMCAVCSIVGTDRDGVSVVVIMGLLLCVARRSRWCDRDAVNGCFGQRPVSRRPRGRVLRLLPRREGCGGRLTRARCRSGRTAAAEKRRAPPPPNGSTVPCRVSSRPRP